LIEITYDGSHVLIMCGVCVCVCVCVHCVGLRNYCDLQTTPLHSSCQPDAVHTHTHTHQGKARFISYYSSAKAYHNYV